MFCAFAICLTLGWRHHSPLHILTGLWGGLTSTQAFTGWLQFSMYQREGWSLIIVIIVLASLVGGALWNRTSHHLMIRIGIASAIIISTLIALLNPPNHSYFTSSAEDDIVHWVKLISYHCRPAGELPPSVPDAPDQKNFLNSIDQKSSPVLITRQMAGWDSGQGELLFVVGRRMPTKIFNLNPSKKPQLDRRHQYIFFIETGAGMNTESPQVSFFMQKVQPELADSFAQFRNNEGLYIHAMEAFIAECTTQQWKVSRIRLSPLLSVTLLTPFPK